MSVSLVLTVIGEDRPGLVEALSRTIADHDGNWLESRMSQLAGKFAGILRVDVPRHRKEGLVSALAGLESRGLRVVAEAGDAPAPPPRAVGLELTGADHPGIVRDISSALARRGVNVEELDTGCEEAPMSGQMLFRARARLRLPADVSLDDIRRELESVAHDLMVDVHLEMQPEE